MKRQKQINQTLPVPADISMIDEGGELVLRTADGMSMYRYDASKLRHSTGSR